MLLILMYIVAYVTGIDKFIILVSTFRQQSPIMITTLNTIDDIHKTVPSS